MGGSGSTRWGSHCAKDVVEDCRILDAARWQREGIFRPGAHTWGHWTWSNSQTGEELSSIGYSSDMTDLAAAFVRLKYTITRSGEALNYRVDLTFTRPRFGGLRWWFLCPLIVNDRPCRRRVAKLYLPPGCRYWGCRHCRGLAYTSSRESHKDERFWLRIAREMGVSVKELGF